MKSVGKRIKDAPRSILVAGAIVLIRSYQVAVRPLLIGTCKFHPSCSDFAVQALRLHGLWAGGLMAIRRLVRCHPFTPGGFDPVPEPGVPDS